VDLGRTDVVVDSTSGTLTDVDSVTTSMVIDVDTDCNSPTCSRK